MFILNTYQITFMEKNIDCAHKYIAELKDFPVGHFDPQGNVAIKF